MSIKSKSRSQQQYWKHSIEIYSIAIKKIKKLAVINQTSFDLGSLMS